MGSKIPQNGLKDTIYNIYCFLTIRVIARISVQTFMKSIEQVT